MIIDSHAHYVSHAYDKPFRYLNRGESGYFLEEGDRETLLQKMEAAGVVCSIEPGVSLESNRELLALCSSLEGRLFPAIGVHPTRATGEKWSRRRELIPLLQSPGVVAVGETGLDYHYPRKEQFRLRQMAWFWYQLNLAKRMGLPLILHVRNAYPQALKLLKLHPARKNGGVLHCFNGNWEDAAGFLELGFFLGIGGSILQREERAAELWDVVRKTPLERLLVETDAPYILPDCRDVIKPKLLRRARNTSLILPAVIEKIAELKGISPETVEHVTARNVICLFSLPVETENA